MVNDNNNKGAFVISLDYELLWGVWDVTNIEKYGKNIQGVKTVIPELLKTFEQYHFKATFATVGILFAKNIKELFAFIPDKKPTYIIPGYNVYINEFNKLGNDETDDAYHFGYSLFELIKQSPHEIATHTFSHYFCLEKGQTAEEFDADIKAALKIAEANEVDIKSMIFPRNQLNSDYLQVLWNNGIQIYRGNPVSWIYKPRMLGDENLFIRLCRLIDTYFPITGNNSITINRKKDGPINIPASRFLKPYSKKLAWFENLKLNRIKNEMTRAAQKKELYHLWWHPHNFGINQKENMENLVELLDHYMLLNKKYGFTNLTMNEAAGL